MFNPTLDKCAKCKPNSFLVNQGKDCQLNPDGIPGCEIYESASKCIKCAPFQYILNFQCHKITKLINGCEYYKDPVTCEKCQANYFLENNTCIQSDITNCEEFIAIDSCSKCNYGYRINSVGGKNECLKLEDTQCIEWETSGNYRCLVC